MSEKEYEKYEEREQYEEYKLDDDKQIDYTELDEVAEYLPVKVEEVLTQKEDIFQEEPKDTSFKAHTYQKAKNQHGFKKWFMKCLKLILFLMCLPFILIVAGVGVFVAIAFLGGGIGLLGGGLVLLIGSAFFSSYLGGTLIMLGITTSVTLFAAGALAMILFIIVIKALISAIKYYYKKRKQSHAQSEVR